MTSRRFTLIGLLSVLSMAMLVMSSWSTADDWGFFAHRRINRLAVFTLPTELLSFYKPHIEYVTAHAVDPDKRRYATKHEGIRHYIDIDQWGNYPYDEVPRSFGAAYSRYAGLMVVHSTGDTTLARWTDHGTTHDGVDVSEVLAIDEMTWDSLLHELVVPQYWSSTEIEVSELANYDEDDKGAKRYFVVDRFTEHGILPYNLIRQQRKLTEAFEQQDVQAILRYSSDIGHYIGDAHVPLHTTTNYNGQLTDQVGIHAFWESRIPELFADDTYDYFVGQASYIEDVNDYYWDVVLSSHQYVDSVLAIEKRLSLTYEEDEQYCYVDRNGLSIRTQCANYAARYQDELDGMVEERLRASIHAVGSAWYTAWVDAGSPAMDDVVASALDTLAEDAQEQGKVYPGRAHWE